MTAFFADADDRQVLDIAGELPTADQLARAAEQCMPIHVGWLPTGMVDLDFLDPVADRIQDLRVYSPGIRNIDAVAQMSALQHLLVDDQLDLPPVDLRHHSALRDYQGRLALVPEVLQLPTLREAVVTIPPRRPLNLDGTEVHALRIIHAPRTPSFAGLTGQPKLHTLGFSGIRKLSLAELPHLEHLKHLDLARIGTLQHLDALHRFPRLRTLTLTDVRHLDADALGRLPLQIETLRTLPLTRRAALQALPDVTALK